MPFIPTALQGVLIFEPAVYKDERGYFFESYNEQTFHKEGVINRFVQDNQSYSKYGVIRGLHYQLDPYPQTKLVRALQGRILDVAVDIRQGSPTFGKYVSVELSSDNKRQLLVPRGFAHGFSVLSETAEVSYKCDGFYDKASEGGIRYDDPQLNIDWQLPLGEAIVSVKDLQLPVFAECRNNFRY
ncbi:MAG: dTDP-4-dehydrorhamnose 3,5-epimerase [Sphingobacteriales bacterium 50-39]|nr:dTDP-4-dehydrorhamnose 3,5-epimerase [Sphingobacteriales bacterium]OJW53095.1 MAG: dTDP-4-dehydrorhamnose 3,5-epimerase [Sphingobacteriales bacterium 50-39]